MTDDAPNRKQMRATLVRFGDAQYEELRAEARLAGVSNAEFIRQAVAAWSAHNAMVRARLSRARAATNGDEPHRDLSGAA